jgi:lipopolysaccharide transport system ATP-binding protein
MSSSDIAISIQNLSKCYQIYDTPRDRLKQFVAPRLQRMVGRKVRRYFREFWALRDVSFSVKKNETVGIIGRNGSGKSTLLQIICGTLAPTAGIVETKGRIAGLLELGSGFNPEFTGRENVYMNASILGLAKAEIDARYEDIVAFADIGDFIDQPVKRYSSGMYVRLAFAVVANVDAEILVIDEALAVGDIFFTQKCMRFLQDFKTRGTIIFVTHDSGAVVSLCERAVWLDRGAVQASGAAKMVSEKYLARRYEIEAASALQRKGEMPPRAAIQEIPANEPAQPAQTSLSGNETDVMSRRDMRLQFINQSNLRNDIQVFDFVPGGRGFGTGGARIISAKMTDLEGRQLSWVVGGEQVRIAVTTEVLVSCESIIVGMSFKDKLGQVLFGQNTYVDYCLSPVKAKSGEVVEAVFTFRMPILRRGSYTVDVAVAEGSPPEVVQLQWLHDAFGLESHASSILDGLVGLIFDSVELRNTNG